jgi:hypothetical protein
MRRQLGGLQADAVDAIQLERQLAHEVVGWRIDQQRETDIHKSTSGIWRGAHYTRSWSLLKKRSYLYQGDVKFGARGS